MINSIANLEQMCFNGLSDVVRRCRPRHVFMFIGGNDLDSSDLDFDIECVINRLESLWCTLKSYIFFIH